MYTNDNRIVMTLDAGGTNLVFSAIRGGREIVTPITLPSCACHLDQCLGQLLTGFTHVSEQLPEAPVAISFAFPGPADYPAGIIGDLPNFPSFRGGVALVRTWRRSSAFLSSSIMMETCLLMAKP